MAARNLNLEPDMEFSAYQNAIFAFLASTVRNLIVRAGAGSGKTTHAC
jgi:predicted transcriptional regulator